MVSQGAIGVSREFRVVSAAVTDSGCLFVSGRRPDDKYLTYFEVGNETVQIDTDEFLPLGHSGPIVGSDGESLVVLSNQDHGFVWANLK